MTEATFHPIGLPRQFWKLSENSMQQVMKLKKSKVIGVIKGFCTTIIQSDVDIADTDENREWMRDFKKRWKTKLEQLELWLVSYIIEIDQIFAFDNFRKIVVAFNLPTKS